MDHNLFYCWAPGFTDRSESVMFRDETPKDAALRYWQNECLEAGSFTDAEVHIFRKSNREEIIKIKVRAVVDIKFFGEEV